MMPSIQTRLELKMSFCKKELSSAVNDADYDIDDTDDIDFGFK